MKVVHLACAHSSEDTRIRKKECESLAKAGYEVVYITSYQSFSANSNSECFSIKAGDHDRRGVLLTSNVFSFFYFRIRNKTSLIRQIIEENPDILHVHEFELMYIIKSIKRRIPNIKVIYDIHEDFPGVYYDMFVAKMPKLIASIVSKYVEYIEHIYTGNADAIITVTPYIVRQLEKYNSNITMVCNYPIITDRENPESVQKNQQICYCGLISENRCIDELLKHKDRIKAEIHLAGPMSPQYRKDINKRYDVENDPKIILHGLISQDDVWDLMIHSKVGVCCYKRTRNYYTCYSTKLFEYMLAGIPFVYSDFPVWNELVSNANCGIPVDPDDGIGIVDAINSLLDDDELAKQMGINGQGVAHGKYNWSNEEAKLLKVYEELE